MKDRITQFLTREGISPAEFADKIGVQRSSVSHVLNGRNYPSASFIQKMLGSYSTLNPRWLLLGEGTMALSETKAFQSKEPTLFSQPKHTDISQLAKDQIKQPENSGHEHPNQLIDNVIDKPLQMANPNRQAEINLSPSMSEILNVIADNKEVERIVLFFKDKTFAAYAPSK